MLDRSGPAAWDVEMPAGVDLVILNEGPLGLGGKIAPEVRTSATTWPWPT